MARPKKKPEEFWVVNLTKQKVSLLEGKLIVAAGRCEQLAPDEVQHPEVFAAKRKGWISIQSKPLDGPLFEGVTPIKNIAVNAADGVAAAMGGTLTPPRRGSPTLPPAVEPIGTRPLGEVEATSMDLGKAKELAQLLEKSAEKPARKRKTKQVTA